MKKRNLPSAKVSARPGVSSDISPQALQRWCPEVRSALEGDQPTISVLDPIGADMWGDGVTAKRIGAALRAIGSVPVNFLSDLDSTGGNSGSATLNSRAELVGLLFDGTFESVNSDWYFDPRTTRTIHVDTRYMLWVMDKVDGAQALIEEMDVVR